ncbi:diaminohydroxyphosphoribosylaminopyrimidine deaminase [Rhizobium sp. NFR07]|uniref:bifunctional diaminohydroxyphosphoribosylaminopyrimidine deaminase/5-amino-6-(5-phosphoribosylamino)uracil reductase RibD n=1 Tax=Rhizobium sp. NFR07 TaxID=1566262 RepID=UPI0008F24930|nr:bifunctional diaminohydroxyphosphoribosylaminopyrimidine deaminase/5-amino-6-(5-phosphoribosylamino)uracil reductase RibD [Rhizobium sp. NFR07]SFB50286.1 diaminohydroxyphosphoribosylaminopyrimidine deaminase [Rhizobium sp. NFR07]
MTSAADDRRFMAAALRLSRWNTGLTATNPSVGSIVVKDGKIVGQAVTARGGRPHSETQALAVAGEKARGATVYVTLEPCSHHGRTPPCANALVAAGVSRVVVCLNDPDPRVSGRGFAILREAGIEVETGLLEDEGRRALAGYLARQTKGRPYVTLKLAVSADGMIGRRGEELAITGPQTRAQVHVMRAESDAILVGIGTALADDPELTVRLSGLENRSPLRIVLDRRLELPTSSRLVASADTVPVVAVTDPFCETHPSNEARLRTLMSAGVEILQSADLSELLTNLATRGISSLMVEGGAQVARGFLDAGLVDRVVLFQSDVAVGRDGLESPLTPSNMPAEFQRVREGRFGADRCFEYERGL